MMKYFCTLSDSKYTLHGMAMYNSLLELYNEDEFVLYYLCLDSKITSTLKKLKTKNLIIVEEHNLCEQSSELSTFKNKLFNNLKTEEHNLATYCWILASYLCYYLLSKENINHIMYIDSDIYFYASPDIIFNEIGKKSVGIIKHRHNIIGNIDGAYNVGIIYFDNSKIGKDCLSWWVDSLLHNKNTEYATCGDQKYLEGFIPNFGEENICVIDKTVGHGAPWNFRLYVYDIYPETGKIIYGDKEQTLVFNHFSRIKIQDINQQWPSNILDFTDGFYLDHTLGYQIFNLPIIRKFYMDYISKLKEINGMIQ